MRKNINFLTVVLLLSSALFFVQKNDFFLLLFSAGMGLLALLEMNVDWNQKLRFRLDDPHRWGKRFEITIAGKIAGYVSSVSLALYFIAKS